METRAMYNSGPDFPLDQKGRPRIIAAIPAFNEERYIGTVVLQTRQHVDEVLVLDDGSTDRTSAVAGLAGATVIRHDTNKGKGAAVQRLLAEAKNRHAGILVFLDADTQHNPAEIPRLVQSVQSGCDLAIGSREAESYKTPFYRRIGQKTLLFSTRTLSGRKLTDSECGFRALSQKAIDAISINENGFAVETEMIGAAAQKGLKIVQVPISNIYTDDGSTLNPFVHGLGVLGRIIHLVSEWRPLLFFGVTGLAMLVVGLVLGILVFERSAHGEGLAVGTALICAMLVILGLLSLFSALTLNAIKRLRR
jgi:glycosyltransferase involved in cell wall biosynthesis